MTESCRTKDQLLIDRTKTYKFASHRGKYNWNWKNFSSEKCSFFFSTLPSVEHMLVHCTEHPFVRAIMLIYVRRFLYVCM